MRVRILPQGPNHHQSSGFVSAGDRPLPPVAQSAEASRLRRERCRCESCREDHGKRTGPACRDPVLTGSCHLRVAWGAGPPLSANFSPAEDFESKPLPCRIGKTDSLSPDSPTAEARRRERRQCGCESRSGHHFQFSFLRTASFAAKQPAFNRQSTGRHRGGPLCFGGDKKGPDNARHRSAGRAMRRSWCVKKEQTPMPDTFRRTVPSIVPSL